MAKNPYAARTARNTTAYPLIAPGGGPTYTAPPEYTTPDELGYPPPEEYSPPPEDYGPPPPAAASVPPVAQALMQQQPPPFDYTTDPGYLAALAAEQAGTQQADAATRAAQEQAIVRFGDPSLAQALGITVDPLTAAMAQQNTQAGNSSLSRMQHTRDLNQQGIVNQLAAHGIINSGDLGYKTGQNQLAYGNTLYDTQQAVLDSLNQYAQQNVAQKQGLHSNVVSAMTGAYQNYISNPAFWSYPVDDGGAKAAANTQAAAAPAAAEPAAQPQMPGFTAPYRPATSRLAAKPVRSPYAYQTARNVRFG